METPPHSEEKVLALVNTEPPLETVIFDLDVKKGQDTSAVLSARLKKFCDALERVKTRQIAVYIVSESRYCERAPPQLLSALQALKSHLSRVQTLELAIPASHLPFFFRVSAPSIHHFALDVIDEAEDMQWLLNFDKPKDLRALTCNTESIRLRVWHMKPMLLCWDQVVELECSAITPSSLIIILRRAPILRKITATKVISADDIEETDNWLVHNHLEELYMQFDYEDGTRLHMGDFLDEVTLPRLRVLESNSIIRTASNEFLKFLQRSRCPFKKIDLGAPQNLEQLRHVLDLLPSLEVLQLDTVREESFANVFNAVFGIVPDGSRTFDRPSLREFHYEGFMDENSAGWKFLARALIATPTMQRLKVTVYVNPLRATDSDMEAVWMDADDVAAVRKLRDEGKEISIECWVNGNCFEDFVEASLTRPPVRV